MWAGVAGIGIALGPLAGGLLVEHFGWGSVFLVNVPICAAALVLCPFLVPNSSAREESPLDPVGALLSIVGLAGLLYAIIEAPDKGWTAPVVMGCLGVGVVFLAAFAWWEWRSPSAMLDVRFFKNPRFSAASATITLVFFALFGSTFLLTQYFQFVLGYSPLKAGVMIAPMAVGMMVGAPLAPRLVERFGTKGVVVTGLCLVAASLVCYGSNSIMSNLGLGLFVRLFTGLGMGMTAAPVTESIMGSLPASRAGVGSAVNDTTRQTGGALGVAVLGSIFAARYHAAIGRLLFVPADFRKGAAESIGTSLQTAGQLGPDAKARLVHAAIGAYHASMRLTYTVAALIVCVAIAVAYRFLPARAAAKPVDTTPAMADDTLFTGLRLGVDDVVE